MTRGCSIRVGKFTDTAVAALFGASEAIDAYNVAYRVPNLLRDLFAEGAMSAAFVPTFTRELTLRGKESAWRLGNVVLTAGNDAARGKARNPAAHPFGALDCATCHTSMWKW